MTRAEYWRQFIAGYDIEKFKRITYEIMLEYLQQQDIEDSAPWVAPPGGRKYTELIIKFRRVSIVVTRPQSPIFRVRYNLYLEEEDLMPYYYYDADFDLDEELVDTYFSTHIIKVE